MAEDLRDYVVDITFIRKMLDNLSNENGDQRYLNAPDPVSGETFGSLIRKVAALAADLEQGKALPQSKIDFLEHFARRASTIGTANENTLLPEAFRHRADDPRIPSLAAQQWLGHENGWETVGKFDGLLQALHDHQRRVQDIEGKRAKPELKNVRIPEFRLPNTDEVVVRYLATQEWRRDGKDKMAATVLIPRGVSGVAFQSLRRLEGFESIELSMPETVGALAQGRMPTRYRMMLSRHDYDATLSSQGQRISISLNSQYFGEELIVETAPNHLAS